MLKSLAVLTALLSGIVANAAVEKYKIDPVHTAVIFKVSHLGFSNTYGQFTGVEGTFAVDDAKPEASSVEIKIKSDSINTHNAKRDQHLKSPDFFNVKAHPQITFKSKSVKKVGDNLYKIDGDLTLNGVTKPQSIEFKRARTGAGMQGETRTGGDTSFRFKRSDFNMKYMNGENQVGDDVEVIISVEGIRE